MNSNSMAIAYPPPWPQVGNAYESYAWALPRAGTNQLLFEHSLSDSPGGMARQEYRTFLLQYRRSVEHGNFDYACHRGGHTVHYFIT